MLGFLDRFVVGIGSVRISIAVHVRLDPVELRRRRRHIGICLSRRTTGLCRGAAEVVGICRYIAKAAHARSLRRAVVGLAAWRARPIAYRRQLRFLHRDLRLGWRLWRLRSWQWWRLDASISLLAPRRRAIVA